MLAGNKNSIRSFVTLLTGISLVGLTLSAGAQFARVKPWVPPKQEIDVPENYKQYLLEAMEIHFLQQEMTDTQSTINPMMHIYKGKKQLAQDQMDALNACNVEKLSDIYQNPEDAWKKMISAYDEKERNLTAYVNAAKPAPQQDAWENAHPYWRIGRELLVDVYANPENYGEVKQTGGFKRWKDQDYIYAEQVNSFLTNVVSVLGVVNVPGVSRQNGYEQNAAAYTAFLTRMKNEKPSKYSQLSQNMLTFPMPPKPLPPANELIKLTQESSQGQLFPVMPEPWAYYAKNKQVPRLPNGEMNEYYKPDSLQLRTEVGDKMLENRFSAYQERKAVLASADNSFQVMQRMVNDKQKRLNEKVKKWGLDISVDMENLEEIKVELGKRKQVSIDKARELLNKLAEYEVSNVSEKTAKYAALSPSDKLLALDEFDRESPEYDAAMSMLNADQRKIDENYLNAMEKDINGLTILTEDNANDVDELMKGVVAQQALSSAIYREDENKVAKARAKKIDKDCLNGGI